MRPNVCDGILKGQYWARFLIVLLAELTAINGNKPCVNSWRNRFVLYLLTKREYFYSLINVA